MTIVGGHMLELASPLGGGSIFSYSTPQPQEVVEAPNFFLQARDNLRKKDFILATADCNGEHPSIALFMVMDVTRDSIDLWNIFGWRRREDVPAQEPEATPEEKFQELLSACRGLDPLDPKMWTRDRKPMPWALEKIVGRKVSADERDHAWSVIVAEADARHRAA